MTFRVRTSVAAGFGVVSLAALSARPTFAQEVTASGPPSLTIYNQQFAVVRETVLLPLQDGKTRVTFTGATAYVETDSVVLRDPTGKTRLQILEQNYQADAVSTDSLLARYEGKTLDFAVRNPDGSERIVSGKVVRSGSGSSGGFGGGFGGYGSYGGSSLQPIVEVEGKMRFGLPGMPLFPALGDVNLLPTLSWSLFSNVAGPVKAELAYVSGGMTWEAAYSLVLPEDANRADFTGLVTISNRSGKTFTDARVQLMAGDISKIQQYRGGIGGFGGGGGGGFGGGAPPPTVTEKSFDEYHLYTLSQATTLKDRETKQVEFVRGQNIEARSLFVYDGADLGSSQYEGDIYREEYGTRSQSKVWIMREFKNSKENHLGIALPRGKVRFYRQDKETSALHFIGENRIDHTPQGEMVRVYTGNAFDLVGGRRQVTYKYNNPVNTSDETFEITLRNRKKTPATVQVVEHLYRWANWEITATDLPFVKKDSRTIEFSVPLAPDEEKKITYTVHYSW